MLKQAAKATNSVDGDPNVSRRVVLTRLAKLTSYAAPVTLALLSMKTIAY